MLTPKIQCKFRSNGHKWEILAFFKCQYFCVIFSIVLINLEQKSWRQRCHIKQFWNFFQPKPNRCLVGSCKISAKTVLFVLSLKNELGSHCFLLTHHLSFCEDVCRDVVERFRDIRNNNNTLNKRFFLQERLLKCSELCLNRYNLRNIKKIFYSFWIYTTTLIDFPPDINASIWS